MLSRRHIRIKTFLALYAYIFSNNKELDKGERELLFSLKKVYELYITFLSAFNEIKVLAEEKIENAKTKNRPTEDDLNPNLKFVNNRAFALLNQNSQLQKDISNMNVMWSTDGAFTVISQIYQEIKKSDEYQAYMNSGADSFGEDKNFLIFIFKENIVNNELLHDVLEDNSIFWNDDLDIVAIATIKTIENLSENDSGFETLTPLFKDEDDETYAKLLFRNAILKDAECQKLIGAQTKNWDVDRLAKTDVILMNMAIVEALDFPSIPVKVTMNEYIEISKFYSTPRSKGFINGILDKIFNQLKSDGKINKMGRGLINKSIQK
ncbi:transcription antitermination factor NusB [Flavobacteriales bacterium]|nr:transcription antitermination factor NusB [Flavobacteriales bacterium]